MSVESINELTEQIKELTKTVNGHNEIIQKGINRTDYALNNKETIIDRDEILKEIKTTTGIKSRLNMVNKAIENIDKCLKG